MQLNDEIIDIIFAWLNSEISFKQICLIFNYKSKGGSVLYSVASYLKEAYQVKKIIIKKNKHIK